MPTLEMLQIYGGASQKLVKTIAVQVDDYDSTLMDFLRSHQVPVASSCFGEGVCRKCIVTTKSKSEHLSCLITVGQFLRQYGAEITINYL